MAGANLSGDLKDPASAIPKGAVENSGGYFFQLVEIFF